MRQDMLVAQTYTIVDHVSKKALQLYVGPMASEVEQGD